MTASDSDSVAKSGEELNPELGSAQTSTTSAASPAGEHRQRSAQSALRIMVLTVSDTRTVATDTSGQLLVDRFSARGHTIVSREIVRDEVELIRAMVARAQEYNVDALLITGGTGVSPRDRTPEAIEPLLEITIPGFGELFRMLSFAEIGAASMLSRALAGRVGKLLVFCLPGSTNACALATDKLLLSDLPHLVHHSRG